jgi:hypothetical protein
MKVCPPRPILLLFPAFSSPPSPSLDLHPLIIGVMKPQLATGLQSVSTAYGDILYRAYREMNPNTSLLLQSLEDHLQDLGYSTIHATIKNTFPI